MAVPPPPGYHPLESTEREWYYKPVKELIYLQNTVKIDHHHRHLISTQGL